MSLFFFFLMNSHKHSKQTRCHTNGPIRAGLLCARELFFVSFFFFRLTDSSLFAQSLSPALPAAKQKELSLCPRPPPLRINPQRSVLNPSRMRSHLRACVFFFSAHLRCCCIAWGLGVQKRTIGEEFSTDHFTPPFCLFAFFFLSGIQGRDPQIAEEL